MSNNSWDIAPFRTTWGLDAGEDYSNWGRIFKELKQIGYRGVEICLRDIRKEEDYPAVRKYADEAGLEISALIFSAWPGYEGPRTVQSPQGHLEVYRDQLRLAQKIRAVHANAQSGADYFTVDESVEFFQGTFAIDEEFGFGGRVSHETHRNRSLFNITNTDAIVKRVPQLKITADWSHWVVVHERLLVQKEDKEMLARITPNITHLHARIGTTQSSQCPEPTNPVFAPEREFFDTVWKGILSSIHADQSRPNKIIFVPEYGPFPYHPFGTTKTHSEVANEEAKRLLALFQAHTQSLA